MRRTRFKKTKRIRKNALFLTGFIIFSLSLIFLLLYFKFFNIKSINVKINNVSCADENQIKDSSKLLGQNFFLINTTQIAQSLKRNFLCIKNVNFSKVIPNHIRLDAEGRDPFARLISIKEQEATGSSFIENIATPSAEQIIDTYIVDNEGVIFSKETNFEIPKIFVLNQSLSLGLKLNENLKNSLMILNNLKKLGLPPQDATVKDEYFVTSSTPKIIFRSNERLDLQIASLQLILEKAKIEEQDLEFIDLRFDKPIVKFAPKKELDYGKR